MPCMGSNLVVKVRCAPGSRERQPKARVSVARRNPKEAGCRGKDNVQKSAEAIVPGETHREGPNQYKPEKAKEGGRHDESRMRRKRRLPAKRWHGRRRVSERLRCDGENKLGFYTKDYS